MAGNISKQYFLDTVDSVDRLDSWARINNCEDDTDINLKRIELLARTLVPTSGCHPSRHTCKVCSRTFTKNKNLLAHIRTQHENERYECEQCHHKFTRSNTYKNHNCKRKTSDVGPSAKRPCLQPLMNESNEPPARFDTCNWCGHYKCLLPGKLFCEGCSHKGRECKQCHRPLPERFYSQEVTHCDTCVRRRQRYDERRNQIGRGQIEALEGAISTTTLTPSETNSVDILQFLADQKAEIQALLHDFLISKKGMKWFLTLKVKYIKYDENNDSILAEPILRSTNFFTFNFSEMEEQIAQAFQKLYSASQEFQAEGSGWALDHIVHLEVNTAEYAPLAASSYIPLPSYLKDKKAILNIKNEDNRCFMWSVLAGINHIDRREHANRVSKYIQYENDLNLVGIDMPVPLSQISKFERQNNISVNVFGYEDEEDGIFPLYVSKCNFPKEVDLLLLSQGEKRHYCLVRNFSRLMGDRTKHEHQTYYCKHCLHGFTRQNLLDDHKPYCYSHGLQKIKLPESEDEKWVTFKSLQKQLRVPFVIYADFESVTRKISSCQPNPNMSHSTEYQQHEPSGFCYKIVCSNPDYYKPAVVYRGPDVIQHFIECLLEEDKHITNLLDQEAPMVLAPDQEQAFQAAKVCHICQQPFGPQSVKTRDHCHVSGHFRGAAHQKCNLNYKFRKVEDKENNGNKYFLPVIFHNLRGYDSHLIMQKLDKSVKSNLQCLANNMEKYISFSIGNLRFIDSIQFLNASLDTLVENLRAESSSKFKNLQSEFSDQQQFQYLLRKGVYPYDFMDDESKFEMEHLPSKDEFYNVLSDSHISDSDYAHAEQVWSMFGLKTMGDYHDLYMKTDVLLLADVFENFRDTSQEYYHLDPVHYYTLPGMGWDAMLKMGHVELELLTDVDMHLMIEKGLRGGISFIGTKYARANNPYIRDFKPDEPTTYIMYWDANNLYGHAMSQPLPERDFQWMSPEAIDKLDIWSIPPDSKTGYILEVDLEYPKTLHDSHSDYPLAPESMSVTKDMLSPHSLDLKKNLCIKGKPVKKLIPNLYDKENYVLHYRNLQFYLNQGLKLTKIHRAIQFRQSSWLKPFIDFNTEKRKQAKNETEKAFFKLCNNSCFGRSMMNVRKHVNVELVNSRKRLRKLCAKPTFEAFKIFNEDLAAVHLKRATLFLNQPVYAGFSILDLSKIVMYDFHYNYICKSYGERAQLCFTDTDSLCYTIETADIYADMKVHADLFDTSNYESSHPLYSKVNTKVLGKMKDELGGGVMEEFVGLRSKMYSLYYDGKEKHTAKGVCKAVIKKQLKHELYRQCLFEQKQFRHTMKQIQSRNHQLSSVSINKVSLSCFDDKRFVLDGVHTLAHGHYKTRHLSS